MTDTGDAADRAALRARQGSGARYDAAGAPARQLAWARRGTAYFARKLNELSDPDLDAPSRVPGWSRRHVIAQVGYQARAISRLVEAGRTGIERPMYASDCARRAEIELGATLPARALRNLFHHAEVHLNVEWRDLPSKGWDAQVHPGDATRITLRDTVPMRAREVWIRAVDLGNGGAFRDFPADLLDDILAHAVSRWVTPLTLAPTDRKSRVTAGTGDSPVIRGTAADLARWATSRGAGGVVADSGDLPDVPDWDGT